MGTMLTASENKFDSSKYGFLENENHGYLIKKIFEHFIIKILNSKCWKLRLNTKFIKKTFWKAKVGGGGADNLKAGPAIKRIRGDN